MKKINFIIIVITLLQLSSCSKDKIIETQYGIEAWLRQVGAAEVVCKDYSYNYYFSTDIYPLIACINLPDSINNNPSTSDYIIDYELLKGELNCVTMVTDNYKIQRIRLLDIRPI